MIFLLNTGSKIEHSIFSLTRFDGQFDARPGKRKFNDCLKRLEQISETTQPAASTSSCLQFVVCFQFRLC